MQDVQAHHAGGVGDRIVVTQDDGTTLVKILAGYHQYHAVNKALEKTRQAVEGDRRIGKFLIADDESRQFLERTGIEKPVDIAEIRHPSRFGITDTRYDADHIAAVTCQKVQRVLCGPNFRLPR